MKPLSPRLEAKRRAMNRRGRRLNAMLRKKYGNLPVLMRVSR